ncbi:putative lipase atg15 [Mortierella claussenii]|nr:putative lipase atg15 [Mortierella claussenii]
MLRQRAYLSILLSLVLSLLALAPVSTFAHPFSVPFFHRKHSIKDHPDPSSSSLSSQPKAQQYDRQQQQNPPGSRALWEQPIFESHLTHNQRQFQTPAQIQQHEQRLHDDPPLVHTGQARPDEVLTLRHILHHGGQQYPTLFRRLDFSPADVLLNELLTGESLTHQVKVKTTTTVKPRGAQFKSFRSKGFRALGTGLGLQEQSYAPSTWTRELVDAPDMTDKETVIQLSKMNYNSYTEVASPGWYDLEGNWGVNSTFGWEEDGVRGHVFTSRDNSTLIIAIKGTSAAILGGGGSTATRDKINDNLLFSCCCAKVDRTWKGVCDCNTGGYQCDQTCLEDSVNSDDAYYNIAMTILWTVQDMYPNANVWLTGHSLGGGLSALLGLTFGVPTVTFQAPGDRLAAQRLHLPGPPAINWDEFPLFHVGHTADPIYQGVCNGPRSACYYSGFALESKCHTGRTCVYDPVGEDNWRVDIRTHRLADTIEGVLKVKDVPKCEQERDCVDCELWEFL